MKSKTYQFKSCEGHLYIVVNRNEKEFNSIQIYPPAKNNDCGYSNAFALQDLVTFALRRAEGKKDIKLIFKAVSGHYCNGMPPNKDHCRSCSDCLASVIKEEFLEVS